MNFGFGLRYLLVGLSFFIANLAEGQSNKSKDLWDDYYKKATVATFYSSTVLNGYDELNFASLYTDSAELYAKSDPLRLKQIHDLRVEHQLSREIASENVNFLYPAFSLMAGYRKDFNYRDEAPEILIENLLEKTLELNDPLNKGSLKENTDYLLLTFDPYDSLYFTVASDYLGSNSGHYCIRYHEVESILSTSGIARFKANQLIEEDWELICNYYGIDQLINLSIKDQGSVIPGLYYKGIYLNYYTKDDGFQYLNYFETFKVDKSDSWSLSIFGVALINVLLTFIGLFLISSTQFSASGRGVKIGKYKFRYFRNSETLRDSSLVLLASLLSVAGVNSLGASFTPDINAFYGEPGVKIWVAFQTIAPFVFSLGGCYLALFKFPNIVVNSSLGYSRILYASIMIPLAVLSYYEYQAELFPDFLYKYLDLIPFISCVFVALFLGKFINGLFKGTDYKWTGFLFISITILLLLIGFYFELRQLFIWANGTYIINGILSLLTLYKSDTLDFFKVERIRLDSGDLEQSNSISNPASYFQEGYKRDVLKWLNEIIQRSSDVKNVILLGGKSGMGKSRLIKEWMSNQLNSSSNSLAMFIGDCNESKDGTGTLYEPFFEAFCLKGELVCSDVLPQLKKFDKGFFTNRTQISQGLSNIVSTASSIGSVDLSAVLSVEDNSSRSVKEIVIELIDSLIDRFLKDSISDRKLILIIDDFQNIDESTRDLLTQFIKTIRLRTKFASRIKILIVHTLDDVGQEVMQVSEFKKFLLEEYESLPETERFEESILDIDQELFMSEVFSSREFRISKNEIGAFSFGPILKGHMEYLSRSNPNQLTPGDIFSYLAALEGESILKYDGSVIRLNREPNDGEIKIQGSRIGIIKSRFLELDESARNLLESAAIIGYKFDAEMLANIWRKDLIEIIGDLEKLEGRFVIDLNNEDNIYAFCDKISHSVIFEIALIQRGQSEVRQLVVEYQKRIIKSIASGNQYENLRRLDVDILVSATERCFKYSNIDEIKHYTTVIGFEAVNKLASLGKREKALRLFERLLRFSKGNHSESDIRKISQILMELTRTNRKTSDFDYDINGKYFLDELHAKARQKADKYYNDEDYLSNPFVSISVVILGGIMQFYLDSRKSSTENISLENGLEQRIEKRLILINELYQNGSFNDPWANARIVYYKVLIDGELLTQLPLALKTAMTAGYNDLVGEISRHYSMLREISFDQRRNALLISLQTFNNENSLVEQSIDQIPTDVTPEDMIEQVFKIVNSQTLSNQKARDFNMLLSRMREFLYHDCRDMPNTLKICDLSMQLSSKLGDQIGMILGLSYKGASLFHEKKFESSIAIYYQYFELLVRSSKNINDFLYPLEGLLQNGNAINDLSEFLRAKEELYEHLLYLGTAAINKKLNYSLYDKSQSLSSLFEFSHIAKIESSGIEEMTEEQKNTILTILRILFGISIADGSIDEGELYDLRESCIALSYSLNLDRDAVISQIPLVTGEFEKLKVDERIDLFEKSCRNLIEFGNKQYAVTVLSLCIDMAKADGVLTESEQNLIQIAKTILN